MTQPEPGQVWERDGERREVVRVTWPKNPRHNAWVAYVWGGLSYRRTLTQWLAWQSGATLLERADR